MCLNFTAFLTQAFSAPVFSGIPHCIQSPYLLSLLQTVMSLSLCFMNLTLLKRTDQIFCRKSLNLSLSNVSSWLDWGCGFFLRISHNKAPFSLYPIKESWYHHILINLLLVITWLRGVFRFLHCHFSRFPCCFHQKWVSKSS